MKLSVPTSIRRTLATIGAFGVVLAVPAGAAAGTCPTQKTTKAFAQFGDTADYALAPKGDFESGTTGWSLFTPNPAAANDSWKVLPGSRSLALGTGLVSGPTVVSTPEFCVSTEHPYFRYMLKANGAVGLLATFISYRDSYGSLVQQQVKSNVSTNLWPGKWKPSDLNPLSINLPIKDGQTARVRLIFVSPASIGGAGYNIDNVLIDPYRRG